MKKIIAVGIGTIQTQRIISRLLLRNGARRDLGFKTIVFPDAVAGFDKCGPDGKYM